MMTLTVYGPGCSNCRKLAEIAERALAEAGVAGEIIKVTDVKTMVDAGVVRTPGLAIDGKLVCAGRIPAPESVLAWVRDAQAAAAAQ